MTKPISWYANRYVEKFGMSIVPIEPGRKFPTANDWGNNVISDPQAVVNFYKQNPDWNMGLALGPSNYCSLDIDCDESFAVILEEFGIDDDLSKYPTIQGRNKGRRLLFRVPANISLPYAKLNWPTKENARKKFTVFELRTGCDGKQRQDVLPPSIHPDTQQPYKWIVQPAKCQDDWPTPPDWLLAMWQAWDKFKPQLQDFCPWQEKQAAEPPKKKTPQQKEGGGVIQAFTDAHDLRLVLEQYGYVRKGRTRYLSPHTTTKLPGVVLFPGEQSCWIHHASDPLCSEESDKPVNAFDLYCEYEHGGDVGKAVKTAADLLGIKPEPRKTKELPPDMASEPPQNEDEKETEQPTDREQTGFAPFRCLGIDEGHYYYLPRSTQQVTAISAGTHTNKSHLLSIAPLEWYEMAFATKSGVDWTAATNQLMRWSEESGTFDASRVRGRGAWFDDGKSVLHLGDRLLVNGEERTLEAHRTKFIYEKKPPLEALKPEGHLSDDDALLLHAVTGMLNWQKPVNATLFAGWLVLAPVCGSLPWRPHVWLTGQRGTGKSWLVDNIVTPVLGASALTVQSNSTEAGIRQRLRQDARPVVFDEAEGENQHARQRMQAVLELARQASSDGLAEIAKGTAGGKALSFKVRSMFMMGSINVGLAQASDKSRFTVLSLIKSKGGQEGRQQFEELEQTVNNTLSKDYCAALRARTYRLIPIIRESARTFSKIAAEYIGNQRAGDQLGALLAGAWSLHSSAPVSVEEAREYVTGQDWGLDVDESADSDETMLVQELLQSQVRFDTQNGHKTRSVIELVQKILGDVRDFEYNNEEADQALSRHGFKVSANYLVVSESHQEIRKALRDTPWCGGWGRILERLSGAERVSSIRFAGIKNRAVRIPISEII